MLRFILLTALYLVGAWYADAFIRAPGQVTLFWPASGIAFAAVIRYGWRSSLFIPVAILLVHLLLVPVPAGFLPFSVGSNFIGVLVGALIISITTTPTRISVVSGFGMLRGGIAMVLVSGLIGCLGLVWSGMMPARDFWPALAKWCMGDLLGIVCIAPSMLLLTARPSRNPDVPPATDYSRVKEKSAWIACLLLTFAIIYWSGSRNSLYALGHVRPAAEPADVERDPFPAGLDGARHRAGGAVHDLAGGPGPGRLHAADASPGFGAAAGLHVPVRPDPAGPGRLDVRTAAGDKESAAARDHRCRHRPAQPRRVRGSDAAGAAAGQCGRGRWPTSTSTTSP